MTFKELLEFTGKTERTIRNWIKKADLGGYAEFAQGYAIDYTIDDIEKILNAGSMSKDAVIILMNNARNNGKASSKIVATIGNDLNERLLDVIEQNNKMMSMMMMKMEAMNNNSSFDNQPKQLALPEAPQTEPRPLLNQLVREYATLKNVSFKTAWNVLYTEILYRCKTNVKTKAKNDGIKAIDYLENENMLLTSCSIMKSLI